MDSLPIELVERILCAVPRSSRCYLQLPTVCKKWWEACKQLPVKWNFAEWPFKAQGRCLRPVPESFFSVFKVESLQFAPWISPPSRSSTMAALKSYAKVTRHDILNIAVTFAKHVVTLDCRHVWNLRGAEWEHLLLSLDERRDMFPMLREVWNADSRLSRPDDGFFVGPLADKKIRY